MNIDHLVFSLTESLILLELWHHFIVFDWNSCECIDSYVVKNTSLQITFLLGDIPNDRIFLDRFSKFWMQSLVLLYVNTMCIHRVHTIEYIIQKVVSTLEPDICRLFICSILTTWSEWQCRNQCNTTQNFVYILSVISLPTLNAKI